MTNSCNLCKATRSCPVVSLCVCVCVCVCSPPAPSQSFNQIIQSDHSRGPKKMYLRQPSLPFVDSRPSHPNSVSLVQAFEGTEAEGEAEGKAPMEKEEEVC
jgi:hypothetical protein